MATRGLIRSCFCAGACSLALAGCMSPGGFPAAGLGPSQTPPVAEWPPSPSQKSVWKLPLLGRKNEPASAQAAAAPRSVGRFFDSKPEERDHEVKDPAAIMVAYAKWQEEVGNLVKARESYENAYSQDPKSVDAVLGLARLDHLAGRTHDAEQRYLKALKMAPNNADALNAAGQFYASEDRWDEAKSMLNSAMLAAPNDPKHRFDLAVALASSGDVQAALPHFARTVGDAEAHYNAGYILQRRGDLAAAEQQYIQAVLKKPQLGEAQAMLEDVRRAQAGTALAAGRYAAPVITPGTQISGGAHTWPVQQAVRDTSMPSDTAQQTAYWNTASSVQPASLGSQPPMWGHAGSAIAISPAPNQPAKLPPTTAEPLWAGEQLQPTTPVHEPEPYRPAMRRTATAPAVSPAEEQRQNQKQE